MMYRLEITAVLILILFVMSSCNNDRDQFNKETLQYLEYESDFLLDYMEFNASMARVVSSPPARNTNLRYDIAFIDLYLSKIKAELKKENCSFDTINALLRKPSILDYSGNDTFKITPYNLGNDSLNRKILDIQFRRIRVGLYEGLYGRKMGCASLTSPKIMEIPLGNKNMIVFGIIDTAMFPGKLSVNEITHDKEIVDIKFEIEQHPGYNFINFHPNDSRTYHWKGHYLIAYPSGIKDTIWVEGKFGAKF